MSLSAPLPSDARGAPFWSRFRLGPAALWAQPALVAAAFGLALALRLNPLLSQPMWLDETWTGMIASQRDLGSALRQIHDDANAPLYYLAMWLWAKLAGVSNLALRLPNLAFSLGAAGTALTQRRALGGRTAAIWGVLLALWWPALDFNAMARCYSLLILVSTTATIAHLRLLERPTLRRAALWTTAAALAILTHYHAAALVLMQGLTLVAVHRTRLLRLWPAALAFAPGLAWGLYHLPRLAAFARPEVAWYPLLTPSDLPAALIFLWQSPLTLAVVAVLAGLALARRLGHEVEPMSPGARRILWTVAASVGAVLLCLAVGSLRPSFTLRYLTPFGPGVLLGLALLGDRVSARAPAAALLLPVAFAVAAIRMPHPSTPFGFERASTYLMRASPKRLEFFWDHPATQVETPDQLRQVGGFFMARAGRSIRVDPIMPTHGQDPNVLMAQGGLDAALLWFYDLERKGVAAQRFPPTALTRDGRWRCRNFGDAVHGVLACAPARPLRSGA